MDEAAQGFCPGCGKPVKGGASFCIHCGTALGAQGGPPEAAGGAEGAPAAGAARAEEAVSVPTPSAGAPPVPPGAPPYAAPGAGGVGEGAPMPGAAPARRSKAPLVIGILGGILIAGGIAVLVLWLAVWRGGAGGTGDPVALAEKYIAAMENGDAKAYMDCFEPGFFKMEDNPILKDMDIEKMIEMTFEMSEIDFQDVALEKKSESGDRAEVVAASGKLTASVMGFEQEYDLADDPLVFKMVKKDGRWYLVKDPMPGSMSPEIDFRDMDLEDMEDLIPEDLNLEDLEEFLPEDLDLEDLENMSPEKLQRLLEDLERMLEELPEEGTSS